LTVISITVFFAMLMPGNKMNTELRGPL